MPTDNDVDCGISFVVSSVSFSSLLPSINRRTRLPGRPGSLVFWAAAAAASAIATKAHHVEMLSLLSLFLIPFPGSCVLRPMCILVLCARSPLFLLHFALTFWVYGIFALWLCCSDAWPGPARPFHSAHLLRPSRCSVCVLFMVHLNNDVDFVVEVAMNAWARTLNPTPADAAVNKANNNACLHKNYARLNNLKLFRPRPAPLIGQFRCPSLAHARPKWDILERFLRLNLCPSSQPINGFRLSVPCTSCILSSGLLDSMETKVSRQITRQGLHLSSITVRLLAKST